MQPRLRSFWIQTESRLPVFCGWWFSLLAVLACLVGSPRSVSGASLVEQIISFEGANWVGDAFTEGGLDAGLEGDRDALVASADQFLGYPQKASFSVLLAEDYSRSPYVEVEVGFRTNSMQSSGGIIYWDGKPLLSCHPQTSIEALKTKKTLIKPIDFSLSRGTHLLEIMALGEAGNTTDLFELDALAIRRIGESHPPPEPERSWLIVSGEQMSVPEQNNLLKLQADLQTLLSADVPIVPATGVTAEMQSSHDLIVVGQYSGNSFLKSILDAHSITNPFAADPQFIKDQGYFIAVYPNEKSNGRKVWLGSGWGALGAVYATSHMRTHFQAEEGLLYLDVEKSPFSQVRLENYFRPDLEERAVYYNIAYGISFGSLTPDNWTDQEWEYWIDRLICSQLTHLYFFLWGDSEVYFPPSRICNTDRNRILHERLRRMIGYAHQRGLKVVYMFSATLVPKDIFDTNRNLLKATIPYVTYGFPVLCQSVLDSFSFNGTTWNGAKDLMIDVYGNELEWFKEADEFHIWFYDPGGCFCGTNHYDCRGNQAERMMEQVNEFDTIILQKNPNAKISVSMWPVWVLEPEYQVYYRDRFLDQLKTAFLPNMGRITVADSVEHSNTCLNEARPRGFRLNGFVFQTNVETGYPFLLPLLEYLKNCASLGASRGVKALHCMRIEEGSKFPNTFFASRFFWDKDTAESSPAQEYAQWVANSNRQAADLLRQALLLLETFTTDGSASQDLHAKGTQIRQAVESALNLLPAYKQNELEWLLTTAKAMEIFGQAVENISNSTLQNTLRTQFANLMLNSPSFKSFAPWASSKFGQIVGWLNSGWWVAHF